MKANEVKSALTRMSLMKFFPSDPETRSEIGVELTRLCKTGDDLRWLVERVVERARAGVEWEFGILADVMQARGGVRSEELPPPCSECAIRGGLWVPHAYLDGVERCQCARGRALLAADQARESSRMAGAGRQA